MSDRPRPLIAAIALVATAGLAALSCGGGDSGGSTDKPEATSTRTVRTASRTSTAAAGRTARAATAVAERTAAATQESAADAVGAPGPDGSGVPVPPSATIRSIDLRSLPDVQRLLAQAGGEYVQSSVMYADLTVDGVEEAVVPIESGGTAGSIAYIVLRLAAGTVTTLLEGGPGEIPGVDVRVEEGKLIETRPIFGPDDPSCCPSFLRVTAYGWDGARLFVESTGEVAGVNTGGKATPPPGP